MKTVVPHGGQGQSRNMRLLVTHTKHILSRESRFNGTVEWNSGTVERWNSGIVE